MRVRKRDLEKLTTEVMQLREFLPRVLNGDLIDVLHKARAAQTGTLPLNFHDTCNLEAENTNKAAVVSACECYLVAVRQE